MLKIPPQGGLIHVGVGLSSCLTTTVRKVIHQFSQEQKIIVLQTSFHHAKTTWLCQVCEKMLLTEFQTFQN